VHVHKVLIAQQLTTRNLQKILIHLLILFHVLRVSLWFCKKNPANYILVCVCVELNSTKRINLFTNSIVCWDSWWFAT
jgi:hypothetical protein